MNLQQLWNIVIVLGSVAVADINADNNGTVSFTERQSEATQNASPQLDEGQKREKIVGTITNLTQLSESMKHDLETELKHDTNWTTTLDIVLKYLTKSMQEQNKNISYTNLILISVELPLESKDKMDLISNLADKKDGLVDVYYLNVTSVEVGKFLLQSGSDLNARNIDDQTVLHVAAEKGLLDVVKWLITEHNMNVNDASEYIGTPLHHAAKYGHLNIVKWLIENTNVDINKKNNNGNQTALLLSHHYIDVCKYLIENANADYNIRDSEANKTLLHLAAYVGNFELVKWLVEDLKMDINAQETENYTVLHEAYKYPQIVKYLLEKGANYNLTSSLGATILHTSVMRYRPDTLKVILENCDLNVNTQDYFGFTALHVGTEVLESVKILVEIGKIDVNIKNYLDDQLAIHIACYKGHYDSVKWLIENTNVKYNAQDSRGNTPLHVSTNHLDIVQYLVSKVDINIKNNKGQNVLEKLIEDKNTTKFDPRLGRYITVYEWMKSNVIFSSEI